jgi:hypothetical protein
MSGDYRKLRIGLCLDVDKERLKPSKVLLMIVAVILFIYTLKYDEIMQDRWHPSIPHRVFKHAQL